VRDVRASMHPLEQTSWLALIERSDSPSPLLWSHRRVCAACTHVALEQDVSCCWPSAALPSCMVAVLPGKRSGLPGKDAALPFPTDMSIRPLSTPSRTRDAELLDMTNNYVRRLTSPSPPLSLTSLSSRARCGDPTRVQQGGRGGEVGGGVHRPYFLDPPLTDMYDAVCGSALTCRTPRWWQRAGSGTTAATVLPARVTT
jgi:hypothetical protein